jgi:hypothetical protein
MFLKTFWQTQVSLTPDKNNGYFAWRTIYIFYHISLSSSWNEKCSRQKLHRKSKHIFCVQWLPPPRKSCHLRDHVEKYCTAGQVTNDNTAHALCMLDNQNYMHTLRICNTYCFSKATMVTWTRLNVTLYVHCLSCFNKKILDSIIL